MEASGAWLGTAPRNPEAHQPQRSGPSSTCPTSASTNTLTQRSHRDSTQRAAAGQRVDGRVMIAWFGQSCPHQRSVFNNQAAGVWWRSSVSVLRHHVRNSHAEPPVASTGSRGSVHRRGSPQGSLGRCARRPPCAGPRHPIMRHIVPPFAPTDPSHFGPSRAPHIRWPLLVRWGNARRTTASTFLRGEADPNRLRCRSSTGQG